jgi:predicted RNase H-like HicB family nuclease
MDEVRRNIREAIELYLEPDEELMEDSKHKVYEVAV